MNRFFAAIVTTCLLASAAQAQNAGTVTSHAFAVGKGPGTRGFTSILCASAQLAVGQSAADPICQSITGDVTISAGGVTAIGTNVVTNTQIRQSGALSLVGRSANSTGNVADISAVAASSCVFMESASALTCANIATANIAANAVTNGKLASMAAYTSKCNNTGSAAAPTDCDATAFTLKASPVAGDLIVIQDSAASNAYKRTTVSALAAAGSVASIAGNTGAFTLSHGLANSTNDLQIDIATQRGYLSGLVLSTAGSSATFGISVGVAVDATSTDFMKLTSAFTKTTAAWAVGTAAGALDTGTIAISTWYHVFAMKRPDTGVVDICVSVTVTGCTTGGNIPVAYTLFRRIGSMKTDGSSQWTLFHQNGDEFLWDAAVGDASSVAVTTAGVTPALTVPPNVPVIALFNSGMVSSVVSTNALFHSLSQANQASGTPNGNASLFTQVASIAAIGQFAIRTNTASQIRMVSTANCTISISTQGYVDTRGRFN